MQIQKNNNFNKHYFHLSYLYYKIQSLNSYGCFIQFILIISCFKKFNYFKK